MSANITKKLEVTISTTKASPKCPCTVLCNTQINTIAVFFEWFFYFTGIGVIYLANCDYCNGQCSSKGDSF